MKQLVTRAIILGRTDYKEADRILTLLTPDYGKVCLIAKGVRRIKSKLAGGIELFSVSEITFIKGRGEVGTLVSTRLIEHYGQIVTDLDKTMAGYRVIKQLHKITEDGLGPEYFSLMVEAFETLNDPRVEVAIVDFWFLSQLLRLGGHIPDLYYDGQGGKLNSESTYIFDPEMMSFKISSGNGNFTADHIKLMRLAFAGNPAKVLAQIHGVSELVDAALPLVRRVGQITGLIV